MSTPDPVPRSYKIEDLAAHFTAAHASGIFTLQETLRPVGLVVECVPEDRKLHVINIGRAYDALVSIFLESKSFKMGKGEKRQSHTDVHMQQAAPFKKQVFVADKITDAAQNRELYGLKSCPFGYVVNPESLAAGVQRYARTMHWALPPEQSPAMADTLRRALINELARRELPVVFLKAALREEDEITIVRLVGRAGYTLREAPIFPPKPAPAA